MTATAKAKPTCPQCPRPENKGEWYHFFAMIFNITKARELSEDGTRVYVLPAQLEQYGIQRQPLSPTAKTFKIGLAGINEDHLPHIPAEALNRPLLFATLPLGDGEANHVLIDGSHTATIRVRRGDEKIDAVILSPEQSRECCVRGWQEIVSRGTLRRAPRARR